MKRFVRNMFTLLAVSLLVSCGEVVPAEESETSTESVTSVTEQNLDIDPDPWCVGADERVYIIEPGYPGIRCEGELRAKIETLVSEMKQLFAAGQMRDGPFVNQEAGQWIWFDIGAGGADEPCCFYDAFYVSADQNGNCSLHWVHMPDEKTQEIYDYCFTSPYCDGLVREIYTLAYEIYMGES